MAIRWEKIPPLLTSDEVRALTEQQQREHRAHVSVHKADRTARNGLYGALCFATTLLTFTAIVITMVLYG